MKRKVKHLLRTTFNEQYDYNNESIIREVTNTKKSFFKTKLVYSLSIVLLTMVVSILATFLITKSYFVRHSNNDLKNCVIEYVDNKYNDLIIKELSYYNDKKQLYCIYYCLMQDSKIVFITNFFSNNENLFNNKLIITINGITKEVMLMEKYNICEIKVDIADNYEVIIENYINDELKLKTINNYTI